MPETHTQAHRLPHHESSSIGPIVQTDSAKIRQLFNDFRYFLGEGEWDEQSVYEFIQQKSSVIATQNNTSMMVMMIVSMMEKEDMKIKKTHLQQDIVALLDKILSKEREINRGTLEVSVDGVILSADDTIVKLSGFSREELIGANMNIMSSGTHPKEFWNNFWTTIQSGAIWQGDICNKTKDGSFIWLETIVMPRIDSRGELIKFKVIRQDRTKSHISSIDRLTQLPNRARCLEDYSIGGKHSIAILHINDMFDINDALGRNGGDYIIKYIAKVLKKFSLEIGADIYKFEGTDFGIVLKEGVTKEYILEQYEKFNNLGIFYKGKRIQLSFSLGIVLHQAEINTLIRHGYLALKESKIIKEPNIFDSKKHILNGSEEFLKMRNLVREAFKKDLFEVHFQEIRENSCSIKKRGVRKFECLVRMYDSVEKTNLIFPGDFLSVVEKDGKNTKLTDYIIEKVCEFMRENPGHFSINLTEDDLISSDFAERIYKKVCEYSIDPSRLTFEILEDIENMGSKKILGNIQALKEYGFGIAIDDFGSGYSNLSIMLNLEPTSLKIDRKYVKGIDVNQKHRSIVKAIIGLAHENGITVVGEGVETKEEQLVLESLGVDESQGYLFSKPLPYITKQER